MQLQWSVRFIGVNRYKSKVKNGVLHEDVVASSSPGEPNDNEWFHRIDAPRNSDASFNAVSDYVIDRSSGTNRSDKVDAINLTNYWGSNIPGKFPSTKTTESPSPIVAPAGC